MLKIIDAIAVALNLGRVADAIDNGQLTETLFLHFGYWILAAFLAAFFYYARAYNRGRERAAELYRLRDHQPCYVATFRIRKWQNVTRS